jgi:hypothetical protein
VRVIPGLPEDPSKGRSLARTALYDGLRISASLRPE